MDIERRYCDHCKMETEHVRNQYHKDILTCTNCLKVVRENPRSTRFPLVARPAL